MSIRRDDIERSVKKVLENAGVATAVDLGAELMKFTNNVTCRMAMSTRCSEKCEDVEKIRKYDELLEKVLKEHENKRSSSHRNGDDNERDILLDVYHDAHAEFKITRTHIKAFFLDLFIAGTETSAEAMQWAMAELLNHPEAFHKVRNEIESVTQNVRECNQDCKINGFDIPAKIAVAINLYAIMRDPEIWEDPNEFHPERFLKEKDDQSSDYDYQNDDKRMEFNFVPFGAGRRGCPGTALAFNLMNTVVAAMVQCFDWKIGEDGKGEKVDMQSGSGMSLGMVHPLICIPVVHFNPYA
ncbi:unnamed protein product [Trifolium pratense]|uniref:Uncharacterized protein n=1 Tax=Trifolium pratense TaxID=57577 RepID=A0ACB0KIP3_TRIPR|nr:unnamed protein product [Trifolium pratense]